MILRGQEQNSSNSCVLFRVHSKPTTVRETGERLTGYNGTTGQRIFRRPLRCQRNWNILGTFSLAIFPCRKAAISEEGERLAQVTKNCISAWFTEVSQRHSLRPGFSSASYRAAGGFPPLILLPLSNARVLNPSRLPSTQKPVWLQKSPTQLIHLPKFNKGISPLSKKTTTTSKHWKYYLKFSCKS